MRFQLWGNEIWVTCILFACSLPSVTAQTTTAVETLPIDLKPGDSANMTLVDHITPTHIAVQLTTPATNWFCGSFEHLPIGQDFILGLSLKSDSVDHKSGDVRKWQGLRPVMTYADPLHYASYEWFTKDPRGHWLSGDPLKRTPAERDAGTAKTPNQSVIPAAFADHFLSADGTTWTPWREVETLTAVPNLQIVRVTQHCDQTSMTVAMRIPLPVAVQHQFCEKLTAAKYPGVTVDEVGKSTAGRPLQVIRVDDPAPIGPREQHRTVMIIAREHATEHAAGWVAFGVIAKLLEDSPITRTLRKNTTWLVIPTEDPDGTAEALFDHLTSRWLDDAPNPLAPEVLAYSQYVMDYIYSGHSIDMVVSLHNVEANEISHIAVPLVDQRYPQIVTAFNESFFSSLQAQGFHTENPEQPWDTGFQPFRFYGWLAHQFHAMDLAFEVNDRYPSARLTLPQLQQIGGVLAASISIWLNSTDGSQWHTRIQKLLAVKSLERKVYFEKVGQRNEERQRFDLLSNGY